jgi:ATP/maltotriose-dependent transcriptional regulator MalT
MTTPQVATDQNESAAGYLALQAGRWAEARAHFDKALAAAETADAYDGLGIALWWLNEIGASHEARTTAYVAFRQQGNLQRAGLIAAWLAREQLFVNNNVSAMQGWFARAERLLQELDPCVEQGWYRLWRASVEASSAELEACALETLKVAATFGDSSLEALALAFLGMARVALGRVNGGLRCLDEAMAMVVGGEVDELRGSAEVFCVMLSACELAGDLVRSAQWCEAAFAAAQRTNCTFLSAYCRVAYGNLLAATGRWQAADAAYQEAIRLFDTGHRGLRVHAVIKLADLRISQGRVEEATVLLAGLEDYGAAIAPLARLHLVKGEVALARAVLEQSLPNAALWQLEHAPRLLLLVEVLLTQGKAARAQQIAEAVAKLADMNESALLWAQAEIAKGQVKRVAGRPDASQNFTAALAHLHDHEQSLLAGKVRLEMALTLQPQDQAGATAWARAALATFERIGATQHANQAAEVLRRLGVPTRPGPQLRASLTQRESEVLELIAQGLTNREIAQRLVISPKTTEHHVSQILSKLGLRSRTEAAAFAAGKL